MESNNHQRSCVVSSAFEYIRSNSLTDKLARLNELLLYKTITVEERQAGHFIPLHRDWWMAEFGNDYTAVQEIAIREGIIEANTNDRGTKKYCSDGSKAPKAGRAFPCSFRLADPFRTGEFAIWDLSRKPRSKPNPTDLSEAGRILADKLTYLAVDASFAKTPWDAIGATFMNRGFHRPHECDYDRFHSVLTGIESSIRKTLHVGVAKPNKVTHMIYEASGAGGRKGLSLSSLSSLSCLVSSFAFLDVKNCQPLCLGIECKKLAGDNRDVSSWLSLSQEGYIYEEIQNWLQRGYVPAYEFQWNGKTCRTDPSRWSRDQIKDQFMVAMFGEDAGVPVWRAIEALWPTVASIAAKIKSTGYERLAHMCQRREASIMIQDAAMHLHNWIPDVPFGTIHDCIAPPPEYTEAGHSSILQAFDKHGVRPAISCE